jgi:glycosyltransferase involved in cell wall biosynthesis
MFSVLMSVYQAESDIYLHEALHSVWYAQNLKPSQIVVVCDGPLTKKLNSVLESWKQKLKEALVLVELPENRGLGAALNSGLAHCDCELVARMDSDDRALPDRFSKQLAFMQNHPDIAASSGLVEEWDESFHTLIAKRTLPTNSSKLEVYAKRRSPLSHPAVMFRKSIVDAVGGYPELRKAQDYALWSVLIAKGYRLANLDVCLVQMRTGNELMHRRNWKYLVAEYRLLKFQKRIGFIGRYNFTLNLLIRAMLRLSPVSIKALMYRYLR